MTSRSKSELSLLLVVGLLACAGSATLLIDVAELQRAVVLSVHSNDGEPPTISLSLAAVLLFAAIPLAVLVIGFVRRWPLPVFLGWMLAAVLTILLVATLASFTAYRYWREYQVGAMQLPCLRSKSADD